MRTAKRITSILLAAVIALSFSVFGFAEETATPGDAPATQTDAPEVPEIEMLETSAVDGKLIAYKGVESYFVIYPQPEESEPRFDVRNTVITLSEEGIVEARPEKNEEYRFGNIVVKGLKLGKTVVTVTDPGSGKSCSVEVTVLPSIIYRIQNFHIFIQYVPFLIFAWIVRHLPVKN